MLTLTSHRAVCGHKALNSSAYCRTSGLSITLKLRKSSLGDSRDGGSRAMFGRLCNTINTRQNRVHFVAMFIFI